MNALVSSLAVGPLLYDDGVATVGPEAPRTAPQFVPTSHSYRASDDAREGRGGAQASYDRPRHDGSGNGGERMAGGRQPRRRSGGSDDGATSASAALSTDAYDSRDDEPPPDLNWYRMLAARKGRPGIVAAGTLSGPYAARAGAGAGAGARALPASFPVQTERRRGTTSSVNGGGGRAAQPGHSSTQGGTSSVCVAATPSLVAWWCPRKLLGPVTCACCPCGAPCVAAGRRSGCAVARRWCGCLVILSCVGSVVVAPSLQPIAGTQLCLRR